jgi:hypothetical protein
LGSIIARRAEPAGPLERQRIGRVAAFRLGLSAESRAAMLLVAKGYRIAARRWKTPLGEIDIVARRRRALVFVEVKARGRDDAAAEAVTERGKSRIVAGPSFGSRIIPTMRNAISASTLCWSPPAGCRNTWSMPSMQPGECPESARRHGGRRQNCVEVGDLNPAASADSCR